MVLVLSVTENNVNTQNISETQETTANKSLSERLKNSSQ